jgi:hypothetical protein
MKVSSRILWITCCLFPLFLSACHDEDDLDDPREAARVLLVYLGGDSNLSHETLLKINAMQEGWQVGDAPVIIYRDDVSPGGSCLLRLAGERDGWYALDTLATYDEENSASSSVLRRVTEYVKRHYPAKSYGLLLFSHASGWLPAGTLQKPLTGGTRSLIIDKGDGTQREMDVVDFASALPDGMFDFIVFETCLTANVELVHALRHKTDYIVASTAEIISPGFTPIYPTALAYLLDTRGSLPDNLRSFAESYFHCASLDPGYHFSATISLIHTAALDELAQTAREIYRQQTPFTDFDDLQHFDRPGQYDHDTPTLSRYFDLDQYIKKIASPAGYADFQQVMAKVVLYEGHTSQFLFFVGGENGFEITHHCGLTTYLERPELPYINAGYRETSWYKATR